MKAFISFTQNHFTLYIARIQKLINYHTYHRNFRNNNVRQSFQLIFDFLLSKHSRHLTSPYLSEF